MTELGFIVGPFPNLGRNQDYAHTGSDRLSSTHLYLVTMPLFEE
jgi:hypothetical protein